MGPSQVLSCYCVQVVISKLDRAEGPAGSRLTSGAHCPRLSCFSTRRWSPGLLHMAWASHSMAVTAQDGGSWLPRAGSRAAWVLKPPPRHSAMSLLSCSITQYHHGPMQGKKVARNRSTSEWEHPGPMAPSTWGGILYHS